MLVLKWRGQSYPIKGTIIKFLLKARQEIFLGVFMELGSHTGKCPYCLDFHDRCQVIKVALRRMLFSCGPHHSPHLTLQLFRKIWRTFFLKT